MDEKENQKSLRTLQKTITMGTGCFASIIGMDEHIIKRYVKHQNHHNEVAQPSLFEKLTN